MGDFFYGVIEGFYGRQWSWQARQGYAGFLRQYGYHCYIYAPKGDDYLRGRWREPHQPEVAEQLRQLSSHYRANQLRWGLGLSPLGLASEYTPSDKRQLQDKVKRLNELSPDILCILFDDVRGDIDGLAARQLEVAGDIMAVSQASTHIVCPTYYSFDPVLEEVFGKMPERYLHQLGAGLPADVGVFWTGAKVISSEYTAADLEPLAGILGRKPIIWDNYPVNDGRLTSNFLHLQPYTGRPDEIAQWSGGHIVNPMNQAILSRLPLQSLQAVYQQQAAYNPAQVLEQSLALLGDSALAAQLAEDIPCFQTEGLSSLSPQQCQQKLHLYQRFDHPAAREVADWLAGGYRFDPDCLTG
ncbi:beta-N-acetylglucosaminidase domain-containing protein [Oceanicoccus sagamiensis]|uniref:GH84 domain-containing protein n=1 Tax=Oceanicoccus sagamiensis TaxID=716816 RepID=A0A1X9NI82_9GAMM|nr:beta-N-acetylglucosaminidase domain-containing protein [Oceanicoccus sagamiensis]ARN75545.1 hypothetical protein BST96_16375 [Oceanicoccus sagamiensis]